MTDIFYAVRDALCRCEIVARATGFQSELAGVIESARSALAALESRLAECEGQEPVAVIGPVWQLLYLGDEPIAEIAKRFGLKIGSVLYAHTLAIREPSDEEYAAIYRNYVCPPVPCEEVSSDVELGRLMVRAVREVLK